MFELIASILVGSCLSFVFWRVIDLSSTLRRTVGRVNDLERRVDFLENNEKARNARERLNRWHATGDFSVLRDQA
jgi:hypothetical protein